MAGTAKDTAKLFMHGRSQAVRLPKAYRLPGTEVKVSRDGEKVVLEPIKPAFDVEAWRAKLRAYGPCDIEEPDDSDLLPADEITLD